MSKEYFAVLLQHLDAVSRNVWTSWRTIDMYIHMVIKSARMYFCTNPAKLAQKEFTIRRINHFIHLRNKLILKAGLNEENMHGILLHMHCMYDAFPKKCKFWCTKCQCRQTDGCIVTHLNDVFAPIKCPTCHELLLDLTPTLSHAAYKEPDTNACKHTEALYKYKSFKFR